ncbi:unnamed protein product [Thlaspi arvense]|uniref:Uncharacterized protein n=1 Tax=Thlaspi arvense TaxID=13288 RepID=A0AAU9SBX5_THLAR|nr:unnamed protein product [Thlaspi arvense]
MQIKQCKSFRERANEVKDGLENAVPGIAVTVNPVKPRRGCFEIREEGGETFVSLLRYIEDDCDFLMQDMKRPFTEMKELNMEENPAKLATNPRTRTAPKVKPGLEAEVGGSASSAAAIFFLPAFSGAGAGEPSSDGADAGAVSGAEPGGASAHWWWWRNLNRRPESRSHNGHADLNHREIVRVTEHGRDVLSGLRSALHSRAEETVLLLAQTGGLVKGSEQCALVLKSLELELIVVVKNHMVHENVLELLLGSIRDGFDCIVAKSQHGDGLTFVDDRCELGLGEKLGHGYFSSALVMLTADTMEETPSKTARQRREEEALRPIFLVKAKPQSLRITILRFVWSLHKTQIHYKTINTFFSPIHHMAFHLKISSTTVMVMRIDLERHCWHCSFSDNNKNIDRCSSVLKCCRSGLCLYFRLGLIFLAHLVVAIRSSNRAVSFWTVKSLLLFNTRALIEEAEANLSRSPDHRASL